MIRYGLGRHIWIAPQGALTVFLQGLFISELCYTGVLVFVKFSILALYWRIFRVRSMQISIYVVATLVTCWGVAVVRECLSNFQRSHQRLCFIVFSVAPCDSLSVCPVARILGQDSQGRLRCR